MYGTSDLMNESDGYEREVGELLGVLVEGGAQDAEAVHAVLDEARLLCGERERRGGHYRRRPSESGRRLLRHLQSGRSADRVRRCGGRAPLLVHAAQRLFQKTDALGELRPLLLHPFIHLLTTICNYHTIINDIQYCVIIRV